MVTKIRTITGKTYTFDAYYKAQRFLLWYLTSSALLMIGTIGLLCFVPWAIGLVCLTILLQGALLSAKNNDVTLIDTFAIVLLGFCAVVSILACDPLFRAIFASPTMGLFVFHMLTTMYKDAIEPDAKTVVPAGGSDTVAKLNRLFTLDTEDGDN